MLSVPLEGQYEQQLNARYLARLGYGEFAAKLSPRVIQDWLAKLPVYQQALQGYTPRDNRMLLTLIDELVQRIGHGERRVGALEAESLGDSVGPA